MEKLNDKVSALVAAQLSDWETAGRNYDALNRIRTKQVDFGTFRMEVQFNPDRARSTTARTDNQSIAERPCFLCRAKRSPEQSAILSDGYEILVNPYPIFPLHLTLPHTRHIPQRIIGHFTDLLSFAHDLPGFTLFYNGAECGASAPDHFHFQAAGQGRMPIEQEVKTRTEREILYKAGDTTIWSMEEYLRPAIVVESPDPAQSAALAETIMHCLDIREDSIGQHPADTTIFDKTGQASKKTELEPKVNVLCFFDGIYRLIIFPRTAHRPHQYFAEGEQQILFSPGAADMAGLIVTVRETDFDRMSAELLSDLFRQLVPSDLPWQHIKECIRKCLTQNPK